MFSSIRNEKIFSDRINNKFDDKIKDLNENDKNQINNIKNLENEEFNLNLKMEEEINEIKLKYQNLKKDIISKKEEEIKKLNNLNNETYFWFKVLTNNKLINNLINEIDYPALKFLNNLKWEYFNNDINIINLIFNFQENEFFENNLIEKKYYFSLDKFIYKIESTEIKWKKDFRKKIIKNKKKEKEIIDNSFFNFFYNLELPNQEKIKKNKNIDIEKEKSFAELFDKEYDLLKEIIYEIIPHASEYYVGIIPDIEEYLGYLEKNLGNDF